MLYDSIIIGAGPAGMTAGIYMLRANKNILIFEKNMYGGQASDSPKIENYPGIPSISGFALMNEIYDQLQNLGGSVIFDEVKSISRDGGHFFIKTSSDTYETKSVIIAAGCTHRKLNIPNEDNFIGDGVSYCATCDGAFYEGKDVVVIGDANSALQYALSLHDICKSVKIYALFDKLFAEQRLQDLVKGAGIEIKYNMQARKFLGNDHLIGIDFYNKATHEDETVTCDGCFIAIGQIPNNENFGVELEKGFIITDEKLMAEKGIFAAGDCRVKSVRQIATAIGDGAQAAIECQKYLQ